jgi:hypothetical protein
MAYPRSPGVAATGDSDRVSNGSDETSSDTGTVSLGLMAFVFPAQPRSIVAARLVLSSLIAAALVICAGLVLSVLRLAT